jgi:hypothetical protein
MRTLTENELLAVSGGCEPSPPPPCCDCPTKGNNGWGNGAEGTNPGSTKGATAGSKKDELWTDGDGPRPCKFFER